MFSFRVIANIIGINGFAADGNRAKALDGSSGRKIGRIIAAKSSDIAAMLVYDSEGRRRDRAVIFDKNGGIIASLEAPGSFFREIAISPNGQYLCYVLEQVNESHRTQLHVYNIESRSSMPVSNDSFNIWPAFSADSSKLAYIRRSGLEGNRAEPSDKIIVNYLQTGKEIGIPLKSGESAFSPRWSSSGEDTLAFSLTSVTTENGRPLFRRDLYLLTKGGLLRRLTQSGDIGRYTWDWDPSARKIAFVRNLSTDHHNSAGPAGIYLLEVENGNTIRVETSSDVTKLQIENLCWAPGGKQLILSVFCENGQDIFRLNVATGKLERITMDGHSESAEPWPSVGKMIFIRNGSEVWTCKLDGFRPSRLL